MDSGFESLVEFRIPWAVFRIPKPGFQISQQKCTGSRMSQAKLSRIPGIRIPEWGEIFVEEIIRKERQASIPSHKIARI